MVLTDTIALGQYKMEMWKGKGPNTKVEIIDTKRGAGDGAITIFAGEVPNLMEFVANITAFLMRAERFEKLEMPKL